MLLLFLDLCFCSTVSQIAMGRTGMVHWQDLSVVLGIREGLLHYPVRSEIRLLSGFCNSW